MSKVVKSKVFYTCSLTGILESIANTFEWFTLVSEDREKGGAEGGSRTRTPFRALPPQDSASANSATSAGNTEGIFKLA